MADLFVQSNQVVGVGGQFFIYPNYVTGVVGAIPRQLSCTNMVLINSVWLIPQVVSNKITRWLEEVAADTSTPPTGDAIKAMKMKDQNDNQVYYVAITNSDNVHTTTPINQFAYLCDGAGGSLPVMPTVTIPFPIIEESPASADSSGDNTFIFPFPNNPLGLLYSIPNPTFNRAAPGTAYVPAGITTPALFVTWANTNWSIYGTWSRTGNNVKLVSNSTPPTWVSGTSYVAGNQVTSAGTNYVCILAVSGSTAPASDATHWTAIGTTNIYVTTAGVTAVVVPTAYCFNQTAYSTPAPVNQVKFGSGSLIPVAAFMLTDVNTQLIPILTNIITDPNLSFGTTVAHKLTVNTVYDVPKLYYNGTLVLTSTAGACS